MIWNEAMKLFFNYVCIGIAIGFGIGMGMLSFDSLHWWAHERIKAFQAYDVPRTY